MPAHKNLSNFISKDWLFEHYCILREKQENMAKFWGCAQCSISYLIRKYGLKSYYGLIGEKFGSWKIIEVDEEKSKKRKRIHFKCVCDCGNISSVYMNHLKTGASTKCLSCNETEFKDYTGKKFDNWTVVNVFKTKNNNGGYGRNSYLIVKNAKREKISLIV